MAISVCKEYELFGEHFMCGKDLTLKFRWSPIRKLVTLAAGTQNMFVTETNHCVPPGHKNKKHNIKYNNLSTN